MINIPENVFKIFIGIGLIGLAFGYLSLEDNKKQYDTYYREFNLQRDETKEKIDVLNVERTMHRKMAARLSERYNLPNPLNPKDTVVTPDSMASDRATDQINDSLFSLYLAHEAVNRQLNIQRTKLAHLKEYLADAEGVHNSRMFRLKVIVIAGMIFFFAGGIGLANQEFDEGQLKYIAANGQRKHYERCQSCGKKFSAMVTCGTNADGSYNSAFCHTCFDKEEFTEPDLTKEELWRRIQAGTKSTKRLPVRKRTIYRLDRWKSNPYS